MSKNRINDIVAQALSDLLKRQGFRKHGSKYLRQVGDIFHIIEVQRSRWNTAQKQSFALNVGVYVRGVISTFRNAPEPQEPKYGDCCITGAAGFLEKPFQNGWWDLSANEEPEKDAQTRADVASMVTEKVLPFFDQLSTERAIAEFLTEEHTRPYRTVNRDPPEAALSFAALVWRKLGENDKFSQCLDEACRHAKGGHRETFITEFAARVRR